MGLTEVAEQHGERFQAVFQGLETSQPHPLGGNDWEVAERYAWRREVSQ